MRPILIDINAYAAFMRDEREIVKVVVGYAYRQVLHGFN
jgi:hypothetical protein